MSYADAARALPYLKAPLNNAITVATEQKNNTSSMFDKGKPKKVNLRGAREVIKIQYNPNVGASAGGAIFREPGTGRSIELLIAFMRDNISGGEDGDFWDNVALDSIGPTMAELVADDLASLKKIRNILFCHGDGKGTMGTLAGAPAESGGNSTVTFTTEEGNRFIDEDGIYFVHVPATGVQHGVLTGHRCIKKIGTTQALFEGLMSTGSASTTGDVLVHKGTADNKSSFMKWHYGFEYFFATSGIYFNIDKDDISQMRGLQVDGGSEMISHSVMEKGLTKFKYRWNDNEMMANHVDFVPPSQEAAYKLLGVPLRIVDGNAKHYDGAFKTVTDGDRKMVVDAHIRPTNWFRVDMNTIFLYELLKTGLWDKDGLQARAPQSNGSIADAIAWIINGKRNYACTNPGRNVWYKNLGTSGVDTGV